MKSTKNSRSLAARRANITRKNRVDLYSRYSYADVVEAILRDVSDEDIMGDTGISRGTLSAVKANLTRSGDLRNLALACNF